MKIEDLIREKCPNGVDYIELGKVAKLNAYKQLGAEELEALRVEDGNIRLLPSSKNYDRYTTEEKAEGYICEGEAFMMGRARYANTKYINGKFVSANNIIIQSADTNRILTRYIYFFVLGHESEIYVTTSTYPRFDIPSFERLIIPIPPIDVQKEITNILNKFTELNEEMMAELYARKSQYEYYRDKLLAVGEFSDGENSESKTLGDVITYVRGITYQKGDEISDSNLEHHSVLRANNISLETNRINYDDIKMIDISVRVKEEQRLKKGDIFICSGSGSKEHIGKVAYIEEDLPYTFGGFMGVIRGDKRQINSKYLYYVLTGQAFRKYLDSAISSATINNLNSQILNNFEFCLPSIEEQERIVYILDRFETLANDTREGLPAEIQARYQQYEYYRDKLLTFNEA